LALDFMPWHLWVPLSAAVVAGGMAFVMSRFLFQRSGTVNPSPAEPAANETPPFDPFVQGSASEQRRTNRRGGNPVEVQLADPQRPGHVVQAWVVDRSMGGLGLTLGQAVSPGTLLTVRPASAPAATPGIEMEVRSCRQLKDDWELGCQFVKTPTWAVMLLFG